MKTLTTFLFSAILLIIGCSNHKNEPANISSSASNIEKIDPYEYLNNYKGYEIPEEIKKLWILDSTLKEEYSKGFELYGAHEKMILKTFSEDSSFLDSFVEIAQASASGSQYLFWSANEADLSKAPIVIFGNEGGFHIVAENIRQLLLILSYDVEPMVSWESVYYFKNESHESSPQNKKYIQWLHKNFQQEPAKDANSIVKAAQDKYEKSFIEWMKRFRNN